MPKLAEFMKKLLSKGWGRGTIALRSGEVDIKSHQRETNLLTSVNVSDKPREKPGNVFSMLSKVLQRKIRPEL